MRKDRLSGVIGLGALAIIALGATPAASQASNQAEEPPPPASTGEPLTTFSVAMPVIEQEFIGLIRRYAAIYQAGDNDLVKGQARPARARAICKLFRSTNQHQVPWVGEVTDMSSTSKGAAILTIKIADGITISTTNNEFSDALGDKTLLQPGTNVYAQAASLHVGQTVLFNGLFLLSEDDCFQERSLTQEGSMTEPDWAMRFQQLRPVD
jgi:hypothetical protein